MTVIQGLITIQGLCQGSNMQWRNNVHSFELRAKEMPITKAPSSNKASIVLSGLISCIRVPSRQLVRTVPFIVYSRGLTSMRAKGQFVFNILFCYLWTLCRGVWLASTFA